MKPTRGTLLIEEITNDSSFALPTDKSDTTRVGKVIAVGNFVYHICGEKIYPEAKVGDMVRFTYNGNERWEENGHIYYSIILDQCRLIYE